MKTQKLEWMPLPWHQATMFPSSQLLRGTEMWIFLQHSQRRWEGTVPLIGASDESRGDKMRLILSLFLPFLSNYVVF